MTNKYKEGLLFTHVPVQISKENHAILEGLFTKYNVLGTNKGEAYGSHFYVKKRNAEVIKELEDMGIIDTSLV